MKPSTLSTTKYPRYFVINPDYAKNKYAGAKFNWNCYLRLDDPPVETPDGLYINSNNQAIMVKLETDGNISERSMKGRFRISDWHEITREQAFEIIYGEPENLSKILHRQKTI